MNKNLLKSILLIITYTVFLVLALLKFDVLWGFLSQALAAMRPFLQRTSCRPLKALWKACSPGVLHSL